MEWIHWRGHSRVLLSKTTDTRPASALQYFNTSHTRPNESMRVWELLAPFVRFAIALFIRNVCTRISKVNVFPGKNYLLGRRFVACDKAAICVGIWTNPLDGLFLLLLLLFYLAWNSRPLACLTFLFLDPPPYACHFWLLSFFFGLAWWSDRVFDSEHNRVISIILQVLFLSFVLCFMFLLFWKKFGSYLDNCNWFVRQ